jgi:hypothetical protein
VQAGAPDERECERLELAEDSVTVSCKDELDRQRGYLNVTGMDAGAKSDPAPPVMWCLRFANPADTQNWGASVKQAVHAQRYDRLPHSAQRLTRAQVAPRGPELVPREYAQQRGRHCARAPATGGHAAVADAEHLVCRLHIRVSAAGHAPGRTPSVQNEFPGPGSAVSALRGLYAGSSRSRSPVAGMLNGRATPDGQPPPSVLSVLAGADGDVPPPPPMPSTDKRIAD